MLVPWICLKTGSSEGASLVQACVYILLEPHEYIHERHSKHFPFLLQYGHASLRRNNYLTVPPLPEGVCVFVRPLYARTGVLHSCVGPFGTGHARGEGRRTGYGGGDAALRPESFRDVSTSPSTTSAIL